MTMNTGSSFGDNTNRTSDDLTASDLGVGGTTTGSGTAGTNIEKARQSAGQTAQELKGAASQATTAATEATRRAAAQAKDKAGQLVGQATEQAKQLTQQLTQQATEQGATMFNEQKSKAAQSLGGVASALRCAATSLHDEHDKHLGALTDSLADNVENAAAYLRDADPRQLMSAAGDFARRRPEWVLGGAFIAGLALVRFLKASRSDNGSQYDTRGAAYDEMGETSHLDYVTSDQFMDNYDDQDLVSRYRTGNHPGIGATASDAGPDFEQPMGGGGDFARTDAAALNDGPDVAITTPAVVPDATGIGESTSLDPDANRNKDDAASRVNPSTGATL